MMLIFKKQRGAMFGLDARIALIIFAALAIVVGAALVFNTGQAEAHGLYKEIQATKEALDSLQYDLKKPLGPAAATPNDTAVMYQMLVHRDAVDSSLQGRWLGPYLVMPSWYSNYVKYGTRQIFVGTSSSPTTSCTSGCYLWLSFQDIPVAVAKGLNEIIDGANETDPDTSGEVLWEDNSGENLTYVRLEEAAR